MCDPVVGGAVAAQTLGMVMNNRAQNQAAKRQAGFARAEGDRQTGFADQGEGIMQDSLVGYGNPGAIAGGAGRGDTIGRLLAQSPQAQMRTPGLGSAPTGAMTNSIVQSGVAAGREHGRTDTALRNFDDGMNAAGRRVGANASSLNFLGDAAARSRGAMGAEIGAVGPGQSLVGDLLVQGGNIGALYGMTRAPQPFGGQPPVPRPNPRR